jgi:hypothetical protein
VGRQQPQFAPGGGAAKRKKKKKQLQHKKQQGQLRDAGAARAVGASETQAPDDEDAIHAALFAAAEEGRAKQARADANELVRAARAAADAAVDGVAARMRVPRAAVAAALSLDSAPPAAGGDDCGPELQRLSTVCELMATVAALADAGATPSQAFAAVGLDGLAAAALVASSAAYFVDWSQFNAAPPAARHGRQQGGGGAGGDDELSAAVVGGASGRRKAGGRK